MFKQGRIKYSEMFYSSQGEGVGRIGIPAAWVRFFTCNLSCDGFGQTDPKDPSTYELPYKTVDLTNIKRLEDLPVFHKGCDSSYSWSARYKHLQHDDTPRDLVNQLYDKFRTASNPDAKFRHPITQNPIDLIFTGGEPLLKANQASIVEILKVLEEDNNQPLWVTFETNGTQVIAEPLALRISRGNQHFNPENQTGFFFSVSPKLFSMAGEKAKDAIKPEIVKSYADVGQDGQLKFVVNSTDEVWTELNDVVAQFRAAGVDWPVMVMPVGGTLDGITSVQTQVANRALVEGYYFTTRLQNILWGNGMGV